VVPAQATAFKHRHPNQASNNTASAPFVVNQTFPQNAKFLYLFKIMAGFLRWQ
jgi:hypothetical protein